jgi:hypothetical protein
VLARAEDRVPESLQDDALGRNSARRVRPTLDCMSATLSRSPLRAVHARSNVFQAQVVIYRVSQFLFASQVMLGGLNGYMAQPELNLFKFSPGQVAESCAGAA